MIEQSSKRDNGFKLDKIWFSNEIVFYQQGSAWMRQAPTPQTLSREGWKVYEYCQQMVTGVLGSQEMPLADSFVLLVLCSYVLLSSLLQAASTMALEIKVVSASSLQNLETLGKSDPYVSIEFQGVCLHVVLLPYIQTHRTLFFPLGLSIYPALLPRCLHVYFFCQPFS